MISALHNIRNLIQLEIDRLRYSRAYSGLHNNLDVEIHLKEAADWLRRAQDAGNDRGVSYGARFDGQFLPSYPETTGYIIPTFLRLSEIYGDSDFKRRAIEMADWEISIQMHCGAVMGGMVNANSTPAVFNTGQVLLGWAEIYRHTAEPRFLDAGKRAAQWLVEVQSPDGSWQKFNSKYADPNSTVYNVKAAWGLCLFGIVAGEHTFVDAAVRNAEYALSKQAKNGWFNDCCLTNSQQPLLHTIAYAMQGLAGIGFLTGRDDLVGASRLTAEGLADMMMEDGFLPGRIHPDFTGAVEWCCLTGSAQTSIVMSHLFKVDGNVRWRNVIRKLNRYLMARHDISSPNPAIRGGIAGSWPVCGDYGRFMVLNWATKFFVDALIAETELGV
ncbi:MAG: hypothetical protein LAP85_06265 [Acidobacteriia bacterium]|nr:hypothetical protein [Terriglobia bacterium]